MDTTRRQLVALGATALGASAIVGKGALSDSAAAAVGTRLGGIHISALCKGVSPVAVKDFPHNWTMTVYGPDNALNGMGWGGTTDAATQQDILNSKMLQCIYSLTGAVKGGVVTLHGLMLFSGLANDQGRPLVFEGNLATGSLRVLVLEGNGTFEGTGVVARI